MSSRGTSGGSKASLSSTFTLGKKKSSLSIIKKSHVPIPQVSFGDHIDKETLAEIREIFDHGHQSGELDEAEFATEFSEVFEEMTEKELRTLFRQIDANANGYIDWDEFSEHIINGNETLQQLLEDRESKEYIPFPNKTKKGVPHRDAVNNIVCHPSKPLIFTSSEDYSVRVWHSETLSCISTLHQHDHSITCMEYIGSTDEIVIITLDRILIFYDCETGNVTRVLKGEKETDDHVQTVAVENNKKLGKFNRNRKMKASDAFLGKIDVDDVLDEFDYGSNMLKRMRSNRMEASILKDFIHAPISVTFYQGDPDSRIPIFRSNSLFLIMGMDQGQIMIYDIGTKTSDRAIPCIAKPKPHLDWVTGVEVSEELHCVITSSLDKTLSLVSLETFKKVRVFAGHPKGVGGFAWSPDLRTIASFGAENSIFLWNPFISRHVERLQGHRAKIVGITFNTKDNQLITLSMDKTFKIWDVITHRCVQTLIEKERLEPENQLYCMAYNFQQDCIVAASRKPGIYVMRRLYKKFVKEFRGHQDPIVDLIYVPDFKQLISADYNYVFVWDIETGTLLFRFHVPKITSMCLDSSRRRIFTSSSDGIIRVWNYINGVKLNEMHPPESDQGMEILSLCQITMIPTQETFVFGGGWNKSIIMWQDGQTTKNPIPPKKTLQSFDSDVSYIEPISKEQIAIGLESGAIEFLNIILGKSKSVHFAPQNTFDISLPSPRIRRKDSLLRTARLSRNNDAVSCLNIMSKTTTNSTRKFSLPNESKNKKSDLTSIHIEQMTFLEKKGLLASVSGDGFLRFWNVKTQELIYEILIQASQESICCVASDWYNGLIVTGDLEGEISVFDISRLNAKRHGDPDSWVRCISRFWRATKTTISSIQFVDDADLIITGSEDCLVEMFTLKGDRIGIFGQPKHWFLGRRHTYNSSRVSDLYLQHVIDNNQISFWEDIDEEEEEINSQEEEDNNDNNNNTDDERDDGGNWSGNIEEATVPSLQLGMNHLQKRKRKRKRFRADKTDKKRNESKSKTQRNQDLMISDSKLTAKEKQEKLRLKEIQLSDDIKALTARERTDDHHWFPFDENNRNTTSARETSKFINRNSKQNGSFYTSDISLPPINTRVGNSNFNETEKQKKNNNNNKRGNNSYSTRKSNFESFNDSPINNNNKIKFKDLMKEFKQCASLDPDWTDRVSSFLLTSEPESLESFSKEILGSESQFN